MIELNTAAPGRSRVLQNLLTLYGAQIVTGLLSLVPIAFLPHYLGALGMGKLTLAISFTGLWSALMITGTTVYIVREIARDHERINEIVSSGVILRLALAIILLPVAVLTLHLLNYPAETQTVVLIMYGAIAIRMISYTFAAALQALENMTWRSMAVVLGEIVAVGVGWIVLHNGGGILGYVLVLALADVVEFAANVLYFVLIRPIRPVVRWRGLSQLFLGGMPFFLWALLQTIYQQTSSLMLSKLGGEEAVGWFGAANQFITPLFMIPSVAITVLLPQFSQLHVLEPRALRRAITRSINYMTLITMPLAFGLAATADRVLDLFGYPVTFAHSAPVMRLLAFNLPASALLMVTATAVAAMNKERGWAKISLFSVLLAIGFNAALIPAAGQMLQNAATGAAAAALAAELLTLALVIRLLGASMIDRSIFITLGKTALAGLSMSAVVVALAGLPLLVVIVIGGGVYVGIGLLLNVLPAEDRATLRHMRRTHWQAATRWLAGGR